MTNDELKVKRERSRGQERQIAAEEQFARWRRSDITGKDAFLKFAGLVSLPIVALWAMMGAVMVGMIELSNMVFKFLGRVIGGSKSLITSR